MIRPRLACLVLVGALTACTTSIEQPTPTSNEQTLADINSPAMNQGKVERLNQQQVIGLYRNYLADIQNPEVRLKVLFRLADLGMIVTEENQLNNPDTIIEADYYRAVIAAYEELVKRYPERAKSEELLYQLAKAYGLNGQLEQSLIVLTELVQNYPETIYLTESLFRIGETHFRLDQFSDAEAYYTRVLEFPEFNPYFGNAQYMQGWSRYKLGLYEDSLVSFTEVLDRVLDDRGLTDLSNSDRELVEDTLRGMSLSLFSLDAPSSILNLFQSIGNRPYENYVFDTIGQLFVEKERHRDSAETYRAFINKYPMADIAPEFYLKLIDAYIKGKFPSLIRPEKEIFVQMFGVRSKYWAQKNNQIRDQIRPSLKQFQLELAAYYQSFAQEQLNPQPKSQATLNSANNNIRNDELYEIQSLSPDKAFNIASEYYRDFTDAFPGDAIAIEKVFLRGESLFEAGDFEDAIYAFEAAAYNYNIPYPKKSESAYAGLLAYQALVENNSGEAQIKFKRKQIEAHHSVSYCYDLFVQY